MSDTVDVHGRDPAQEAYHISTSAGRAMVPEHLMASAMRPGVRPSHQDAYEWIAANRQHLAQAIRQLSQGTKPKTPFDTMTLLPPNE